MSAVTFDTMKLVDALEKANIPRDQARAIVDVVRESRDSSDGATKGDLRELELRVRGEIAEVRKDIDAMENRLIIKLSAVMVGLIAFAGAMQAVVSRL